MYWNANDPSINDILYYCVWQSFANVKPNVQKSKANEQPLKKKNKKKHHKHLFHFETKLICKKKKLYLSANVFLSVIHTQKHKTSGKTPVAATQAFVKVMAKSSLSF